MTTKVVSSTMLKEKEEEVISIINLILEPLIVFSKNCPLKHSSLFQVKSCLSEIPIALLLKTHIKFPSIYWQINYFIFTYSCHYSS